MMMKLLKFVPGAIALGLAGAVCVGSMYVTLAAAVQQDGDEAVVDVADKAIVPVAISSTSGAVVGTDGVVLGENGVVSGSFGSVAGTDGVLDPVEGLLVHFIRNGEIAGSSVTTEDGSYSASGLEPGIYSIIASGDNGFCAIGIRAVAGDATSEPTQLMTAVVPPRDFLLAKHLVNKSLSTEPHAWDSADVERESTRGNQPSTAIQHHQLNLGPDGSLQGVVNLLTESGEVKSITDFTLDFIMGDTVVASTSLSEDGSFRVMGLTPGAYSVVGTGEDGVLALGIDVLGAFAVALEPGEFRPTNVIQGVSMAVAAVGTGDFNADNAADVSNGFADGAGAGGAPGSPADTPPPADPAAEAAGAAGAPGTGTGSLSGGGGAGVGGGSGMGALLGAGLGALAGWAIADNNGNNNGDAAASPSR
jgi:hypothetical protein